MIGNFQPFIPKIIIPVVADTTGAVDATIAIQRAIDQAAYVGGIAMMPTGRFKITSGITLYDQMSFLGCGGYGTVNGQPDVIKGTVLDYSGPAGVTILSMFGKSYCRVGNFTINNNNIAGTTGLLIDSDNNPISQNNLAKSVSFLKFPNIGIQVGTSGAIGYQSDFTHFSECYFQECGTGILFNSSNAANCGVIEKCNFWMNNKHIDIERSGNISINSCKIAGYIGLNPVGLRINSISGLNVSNSIFEAAENIGALKGTGVYVFSGDYSLPMEFKACVIENFVVNHLTKILTSTCTFGGDPSAILFKADNILWISMNDVFLPPSATWNVGSGLFLDPGVSVYRVNEISATGSVIHM